MVSERKYMGRKRNGRIDEKKKNRTKRMAVEKKKRKGGCEWKRGEGKRKLKK